MFSPGAWCQVKNMREFCTTKHNEGEYGKTKSVLSAEGFALISMRLNMKAKNHVCFLVTLMSGPLGYEHSRDAGTV